jgi:hypothetical protein
MGSWTRGPGIRSKHLVGIIWLTLGVGTGPGLQAAELEPRTIQAFDRYTRLTEARIERELTGGGPVLWVDLQPEPERAALHRELAAGEIVVRRLETQDAGEDISIPGGRVHHWLGIAFIPKATLSDTIAMVQSYERYPEIYRPNVRQARTLSRDGSRFTVSMQLFMKKIVSVVLNTQYEVDYRPLGPTRMFVPSRATRIAEVEDPDTPGAREKPVGRDSGFLWRFNNYCTFEQRDGGTFMQCESLSLSRGVPLAVAWLIGPFVTGVPRESLTFTLTSARRHLTR